MFSLAAVINRTSRDVPRGLKAVVGYTKSFQLSGLMTEQPSLWRSALLLARGVVLISAITVVCYALGFNAASTALIYLVGVVLQSLDSGFVEAAIVSLFATGSLDFFFIDPRFSFAVNRVLDVVTLGCLLIAGLIVTRIQARSRSRAMSAASHRLTAESLYSVSQELLALDPSLAAGPELLRPFLTVFGLSAVCLFESDTFERHIAGSSRNDLEGKTREAYLCGGDVSFPDASIVIHCLRAGQSLRGAIGFEGLRSPELCSSSLAALATATLERGRGFRTATAARAHAQAEMLRSAILDALAHEIKTPLATILTAAGGIRELSTGESERDELAEIIEAEACRLNDLTSKLLRMARLDTDEVMPRLQQTDLSGLLTKVVRRYSELWPDGRIYCYTASGAHSVSADPDLIALALNQILENACRYSGADAHVLLNLASLGKTVAVIIRNNGPSIPLEERHRIFERFFRGAAALRATSGSGLGLYIARKIVLAHGGELALDELASPGVCFRLTLPCIPNEVSVDL